MRDPCLPSYGDKHPRFGAPLGENDTEALAEFLTVLFEIGYFPEAGPDPAPVVTFEVRPLPASARTSTDRQLPAGPGRCLGQGKSEVQAANPSPYEPTPTRPGQTSETRRGTVTMPKVFITQRIPEVGPRSCASRAGGTCSSGSGTR